MITQSNERRPGLVGDIIITRHHEVPDTPPTVGLKKIDIGNWFTAQVAPQARGFTRLKVSNSSPLGSRASRRRGRLQRDRGRAGSA
jgi:hypothetical protein